VLKPVSPLAWMPLALYTIKDSSISAIFVIFICSLWPMLINTAFGVNSVRHEWLNVARTLEVGAIRRAFTIILPAAAATILTGMRISIGIAWLVIVAAEMLVGGTGIGYFVETIDLSDRLLYPEIDGRRASWDEALDTVAHRFTQYIAEHGPEAVAFYVSGQLLTEDYYVANKLMKGFIGTANIDTNSRLCMSSSVAGHIRAFGSDTVPSTYKDLEEADLVVLVGSNLAWCHPVLFQRLMAGRAKRGTRVVVVDPRRTVTVESADMRAPVMPRPSHRGASLPTASSTLPIGAPGSFRCRLRRRSKKMPIIR
jgi:hypothetical protein